MGDVMAVGEWKSNAEMMVDVARLGYVGESVLDATYGLGNFWATEPPGLIRNDLDPNRGDHTVNMASVQAVEEAGWSRRFDTVLVDPPYRLSGRKDSPMDDRYGLSVPDSEVPRLLFGMAIAGVVAVKPGGYLLFKCQDQQWKGSLFQQAEVVVRAVHDLKEGRLCDRFLLVSTPRPQPPGRVQRTARSNYSTLLVFKATGGSGQV